MQTGRVASGFRSTYRGSQWPSSSKHAGVQQRAPERSVRHGVGAAVPGVSRKTGGATPRYDDSDVFVLGRRGPRRDGQRRRAYPLSAERRGAVRADRPRAGRDVGDYWQVASRDGLVSIYGTPRPRRPPGWSDPAVLTDIGDAGRIAAWRLTSTTDPFQNRVVYEWQRHAELEEDGRRANQSYLSAVRYHEHMSDSSRFLVSVAFSYVPRLDRPRTRGRASRSAPRVCCNRIDVRTHPDSGAGLLMRSYGLEYVDQDPALPRPPNAASLLRRIGVEGHDGGTEPQRLPPLELGYTEFEPARQRYAAVGGDSGAVPERSLGLRRLRARGPFGAGLPPSCRSMASPATGATGATGASIGRARSGGNRCRRLRRLGADRRPRWRCTSSTSSSRHRGPAISRCAPARTLEARFVPFMRPRSFDLDDPMCVCST